MRRVDATLTTWQHFSLWNDVMAAIFKVWCHMSKIPLRQSIDAHLLGEQYCEILSRSDLKRRSLRVFWRGRSNKKNKEKNKRWIAILDQFLTQKSSSKPCLLGQMGFKCKILGKPCSPARRPILSPDFFLKSRAESWAFEPFAHWNSWR